MKSGYYTSEVSTNLYVVYPNQTIDYWSIIRGKWKTLKAEDYKYFVFQRKFIFLGKL